MAVRNSPDRLSVGDSWATNWESFLGFHQDWWNAIPREQHAVYPLTPCLIQALGNPPAKKRRIAALLMPEKVHAEVAFARLCRSFPDVVAVNQQGQPVRYPLWTTWDDPKNCVPCAESQNDVLPSLPQPGADRDHRSPPLNLHPSEPAPTLHPNGKSVPGKVEAIDHLGAIERLKVIDAFFTEIRTQFDLQATGDWRNRIAYAGGLLQKSDFAHDLHLLRQEWEQSKPALPWDLLSGQNFSLPGITLYAKFFAADNEQRHHLLTCVGAFAQKWAISGFATWDLPIPSGPLRDVSADLIPHRIGPDFLVSLPQSYLISRRDASSKVGARSPVGTLTSEDEHIFRLNLLDVAVRQRFSGEPRGLKTRFKEAMSQHFFLCAGSIDRFRGRYPTPS